MVFWYPIAVMSLRQYVMLMLIGTLLCWGAWGLVVFTLDPTTAGALGFVLFYTALFCALLGSFALLGLGFRMIILRDDAIVRQVTLAFRQSFSFAFLAIAALVLQSQQLLTWWNMLFLVCAVTLVEIAVVSRHHRVPVV